MAQFLNNSRLEVSPISLLYKSVHLSAKQEMAELQGMHDVYVVYFLTSICRSMIPAELVIEKCAPPLIALCAKQRESRSPVCSAE